MVPSTAPTSHGVRCGNRAYHGEQVVYHASAAAVRECYALHGRFATKPAPAAQRCCDGTGWTGDSKAPCAEHYQPQHFGGFVTSGVWHSTGYAAEDGHYESQCPGFTCPVVQQQTARLAPTLMTFAEFSDANEGWDGELSVSEQHRAYAQYCERYAGAAADQIATFAAERRQALEEGRERLQQWREAPRADRYAKWRQIPVGGSGYGYYALEEDHVSFYRVERPKKGKWAGRTFVKVQAGDDFHALPRETAYAVMDKIAEDPQTAGMLYARELGRCSRCGRTLTDETSRERGMGPDCFEKGGW